LEIIRVYLDQNMSLNISLGNITIIIFLLILLVVTIYYGIKRQSLNENYQIDEAEIGIGQSKIKIKSNYQDIQIAYKLWIELSTRKIGLPIDFKHDVIAEIYDSWYQFFKVTRDLLKEIPIEKIRRNKSTIQLVNVVIDVLNKGLRPHLTEWQAKFRKWYEAESKKDENKDISPQQLQEKYPLYNELVKSMEEINAHLIKYRKTMKEIAIGE